MGLARTRKAVDPRSLVEIGGDIVHSLVELVDEVGKAEKVVVLKITVRIETR